MSTQCLIGQLLMLASSGLFLSFTPAPVQENPNPPEYYRNTMLKDNPPMTTEQIYRSQRINSSSPSGREEVAYMDDRDVDIHSRAERRGDWDYKGNWRYNRGAFYAGENQPDPYNDQDLPYSGGIGRDRDEDYVRMMNEYYSRTGERFQGDRYSQPPQGSYSDERQALLHYNSGGPHPSSIDGAGPQRTVKR